MKLGTTAFSFTNEWLARGLTLEQLLRRVAGLGLGPGVELIGFQAWRGYPALGRAEVAAFRGVVDELELVPAALGVYADLARRLDRAMTVDETVDFLVPQVTLAAKLGFPLVRLHAGIPVAALERVARVAEHAGVVLATEVQGGQSPGDPAVARVLEGRERVGPTLALALDSSVAMQSLPRRFVAALHERGMRAEDVDALAKLWQRRAPTRELFAAVHEVDAPSAALDEARAGFIRFGRQEPSDWLPLVSAIAYVHAKFWELDDAGDDPTTRTAEVLDVLRTGGYEGFVASEWGGNAWADAAESDAFELVRRHRSRVSDLISTSAVEVTA
jgi:hypothetical protein